MKLYSVYDSKAAHYAPPFFAENDDMAKRTIAATYFSLEKQMETNSLVLYPSEFCLFHVGEMDDDTGVLRPLESPLSIGTVLQIVSQARQAPKVQVNDE